MALSIYIYVGGEETEERVFQSGTKIGVHGKFSAWWAPLFGARVVASVLGTAAVCYTDVAGWYKCTLTLPRVTETTETSIKVTADSPLLFETKYEPITILGMDGNGPPPEKQLLWGIALVGGAALLGIVIGLLTKKEKP